VPAQCLARWDGENWSSLGWGLNGPVSTSAVEANGALVVGGSFTEAGGLPSAYLARLASACLCPTDLDDNGDLADGGDRDGAVTVDDLLYFLTGFEAGAVAVDLDDDGDPLAGHPDGAVTIEDLLFFVARFELGC
jgi:hypothetical protein